MTTTLDRRGFLKLNSAATIAAGVAIASTGSTQRLHADQHAATSHTLNYGPPPGIAKLDSNENPFGPSPAALSAIQEAAKNGAYYVDASVTRLKAMIAERHGLTPAHVSLSSGSSGVLSYLAVAKTREGHILGPDLFWDTTAKAGVRQGGEIRRLPKSADLAIDLAAMAKAITADTALVHITNPNNPTGMLLDAEALRAFCISSAKKTMVLVDEAYNEITDRPDFNTMIPLIKAGHNVVVARTFSKLYGLAGMRVGYALSSPETAELITRYGIGDYALNQAGLAAAIASYNDIGFLAKAKSSIIETREAIVAALRKEGLQPLPSVTNFVFTDLGDVHADSFRSAMAAESVLIRGVYRDYHHHSRVSTGLPEDVNRYVSRLPKVLDRLRSESA